MIDAPVDTWGCSACQVEWSRRRGGDCCWICWEPGEWTQAAGVYFPWATSAYWQAAYNGAEIVPFWATANPRRVLV